MPMEQCCGSLWGLSWRNASDGSCLSCTYTLLPGQTTCMHVCPQTHKHQHLQFFMIIALLFICSLQTPSPPLWSAVVCWAASELLRARPRASHGAEPITAHLTGSTSTFRAAARTCWPRPLMAPGRSTSAQCVAVEVDAARCVPLQSPGTSFCLLLVAECILSSPLSGFKDDVWPRFGFRT